MDSGAIGVLWVKRVGGNSGFWIVVGCGSGGGVGGVGWGGLDLVVNS